MIVASDLNGTLTTGAPILALADWVDFNQPGLKPKLFKFQMLTSYLLVKFGLVDTHIWADKYLREVLNLFYSPTPDIVNQAMSYIVDAELWPKRIPKAIDFLLDLHKQGAEIILVSAAFEQAVVYFGKKIASENITGIGTPVYLEKGKLCLEKDLTVKERKLALLKERIGAKKIDYALGDSISDLPMLEEATHPIAVSPDKQLRKIAAEREWRIIE
jgi:phosphoserine phosphatase